MVGNQISRSYHQPKEPYPLAPAEPRLESAWLLALGSVDAKIATGTPRSVGDLIIAVDDVCRNISSGKVIRAVENFRSRAEKCIQEFPEFIVTVHSKQLYYAKWPDIIFYVPENQLSMTNFQELIGLNFISLFGKNPVVTWQNLEIEVVEIRGEIDSKQSHEFKIPFDSFGEG